MIKKVLGLLLIIVMTISFCFYKRNTIHWKSFDKIYEGSEQYYTMPIQVLNENLSGIYTSYYHINSIEELEKYSDLIAIVQLKDRKQIYNNIESTVEILKIFKGVNDKKTVNIIEAGYIFENKVYNDGFLPLLKENQMYLVFLQETNGFNTYNYVDPVYSMHILKDQYNIKRIDYTDNLRISHTDIEKYDYYIVNYSQVTDDSYTSEQIDKYKSTINKYFKYNEELKKIYK